MTSDPVVSEREDVTPASPAAPNPAATGDTPPTPPGDLPYDEWKKLFDAHMRAAEARADRYPPGFQADVSRESIYEGCGE